MSSDEFRYTPGGFGVRLVGAMIDGIIISLATTIINLPLVILVARMVSDPNNAMGVSINIGMQILNWIISGWYLAYFLSRKGATPGKSVMKLKVLHAETGAYVSAGRAIAREFLGKSLCVLTLGIGFLMVLFREDRRGLHDLLFKTRVVRKNG